MHRRRTKKNNKKDTINKYGIHTQKHMRIKLSIIESKNQINTVLPQAQNK